MNKESLYVIETRVENGKVVALLQQKGAPAPYIIAHGFNEETMDWSYGSYYGRLVDACMEFDKDVVTDLSVVWEREDFEEIAQEYLKRKPTRKEVDELIFTCRGIQDWATEEMSDGIHQDARDLFRELA